MSKFVFFLAFTLATSYASYANAGCRSQMLDNIVSELCPEAYIVKTTDGYNNYIACGELNTDTLLTAKVDSSNNLSTEEFYKTTGQYTVTAVDLNLIPDDSTDKRYSYIRPLKANGKTVGYINYAGYSNSENEAFFKFKTIYNLMGNVAAIYCD